MKITHIITLTFVFFQFSIIAQDIDSTNSKKLVLITKNNGGEFIGEIISDDGREILLMTTTIGKIYINKSDISGITLVDEKSTNKVGGEFRAEGPFTTRYFFTNNSLPLKKNEHYAMIQLYGPEVHFSVSDKLSLGIMASWIASPIALASKLCLYSKNNIHISLGNILGNSGYIEQGKIFGGLHWLTITKGDRMKNFSFSAGYGYVVDNSDLFNNNYIGEDYTFQSRDENSKYYVPNSNIWGNSAYSAVWDELYSQFGNSNSIYSSSNLKGSYILSLAGIIPVGKKASLIFDSMLFLSQQYSIQYEDHNVNVDYEEFNSSTGQTTQSNETFTVGINGRAVKGSSFNTTLLLMPSLRINQSYEKAFQISLAGVITQEQSFPVPTISWLRKF
tara:strand:- start:1841 stop:3010 length:1170 start_codon:yes stop_codon:yes gene_type:complete